MSSSENKRPRDENEQEEGATKRIRFAAYDFDLAIGEILGLPLAHHFHEAKRTFRIATFGEVNCGKSSFLNGLWRNMRSAAKDDQLGLFPESSGGFHGGSYIPVRLRYAPDYEVTPAPGSAQYSNWTAVAAAVEILNDQAEQTWNKKGKLSFSEIVVSGPVVGMPHSMEIIDLPSVNVLSEHKEEFKESLKDIDVLIMFTNGPPSYSILETVLQFFPVTRMPSIVLVSGLRNDFEDSTPIAVEHMRKTTWALAEMAKKNAPLDRELKSFWERTVTVCVSRTPWELDVSAGEWLRYIVRRGMLRRVEEAFIYGAAERCGVPLEGRWKRHLPERTITSEECLAYTDWTDVPAFATALGDFCDFAAMTGKLEFDILYDEVADILTRLHNQQRFHDLAGPYLGMGVPWIVRRYIELWLLATHETVVLTPGFKAIIKNTLAEVFHQIRPSDNVLRVDFEYQAYHRLAGNIDMLPGPTRDTRRCEMEQRCDFAMMRKNVMNLVVTWMNNPDNPNTFAEECREFLNEHYNDRQLASMHTPLYSINSEPKPFTQMLFARPPYVVDTTSRVAPARLVEGTDRVVHVLVADGVAESHIEVHESVFTKEYWRTHAAIVYHVEDTSFLTEIARKHVKSLWRCVVFAVHAREMATLKKLWEELVEDSESMKEVVWLAFREPLSRNATVAAMQSLRATTLGKPNLFFPDMFCLVTTHPESRMEGLRAERLEQQGGDIVLAPVRIEQAVDDLERCMDRLVKTGLARFSREFNRARFHTLSVETADMENVDALLLETVMDISFRTGELGEKHLEALRVLMEILPEDGIFATWLRKRSVLLRPSVGIARGATLSELLLSHDRSLSSGFLSTQTDNMDIQMFSTLFARNAKAEQLAVITTCTSH